MRRSGWVRLAMIVTLCTTQACATPVEESATQAPPAASARSSAAPDQSSDAPAQSSSSAGGFPSASASPASRSSDLGSTAEEYLRWAGQSNDAMDELWAKYAQDFASLGEAALFYREYAEITRQFADRILAMEFPTAIADEARELVRRLNEEVNAAMRASQASSWDELWTAEEDLDRVSGFSTDAANRVRAGLGLPSAPPIGSDE